MWACHDEICVPSSSKYPNEMACIVVFKHTRCGALSFNVQKQVADDRMDPGTPRCFPMCPDGSKHASPSEKCASTSCFMPGSTPETDSPTISVAKRAFRGMIFSLFLKPPPQSAGFVFILILEFKRLSLQSYFWLQTLRNIFFANFTNSIFFNWPC